MISTKEQERKALEQIKTIVDGLGEDSYIRTAFDGAFEDAENNIKDDAAYSMKARYEFSEKQLEKALEEIKQLKEKLAKSKADLEAAHSTAIENSKQKDKEVNSLKARVLSPDDIFDITSLILSKTSALEAEVKNAAERIVENATNPDSAIFRNDVKEHRAATSELDHYTALLKRVCKAKGE